MAGGRLCNCFCAEDLYLAGISGQINFYNDCSHCDILDCLSGVGEAIRMRFRRLVSPERMESEQTGISSSCASAFRMALFALPSCAGALTASSIALLPSPISTIFGLRGFEIPGLARIIRIAPSLDIVTSCGAALAKAMLRRLGRIGRDWLRRLIQADFL